MDLLVWMCYFSPFNSSDKLIKNVIASVRASS
jgi:hypothetical protein